MIEFKKLHDSFLIHQAFVAAAAAAINNLNSSATSNGINSSSSSGSSNVNTSSSCALSPSSTQLSINSSQMSNGLLNTTSNANVQSVSPVNKDQSIEIASSSYSLCSPSLSAASSAPSSPVACKRSDCMSESCLNRGSKRIKLDNLHWKSSGSRDNNNDEIDHDDHDNNDDDEHNIDEHECGEDKASNADDDGEENAFLAEEAHVQHKIQLKSGKRKSDESELADKCASVRKASSSFFISDILGLNSASHAKISQSSHSILHQQQQQPLQTNPMVNQATTTAAAAAAAASYLNERLMSSYSYQLQRSFVNPMDFYRFLASSINYDSLLASQANDINGPNMALRLNSLQAPLSSSSSSYPTSSPLIANQQYAFAGQMSTPLKAQVECSQTPIKIENISVEKANSQATHSSNTSASASILSSLEQLTKNQFKDSKSLITPKTILNGMKKSLDSGSTCSVELNSTGSCQTNASTRAEHSSKHSIVNSSSSESVNKPNEASAITSSAATSTSDKKSNSAANANNQNGANLWPAWVYCTRYSDRPSAGPRQRKKTKKNAIANANRSSSNISGVTKKSDTSSGKKDSIRENNASNTSSSKFSNSNNHNNNNNLSYMSSSSSSNSSFSLSSPSQHSSPFLNALQNGSKKYSDQLHPSGLEYSEVGNKSSSLYGGATTSKSNHENEYERGSEAITSAKMPSHVVDNDDDLNNDDDIAGAASANDYFNDDDDDDDNFDDNDSNASHSKRPRTAFTSSQLNRLKHEFEKCKYLTGEKRQYLANELNLNESQIKIWFQNKRAKIKKASGVKNTLALQLMAQGLYNHASANNKPGSD